MKDNVYEDVIGFVILAAAMLLVFGSIDILNVPASVGVCIGFVGLGVPIVGLALWQQNRERTRWSEACAALGLELGPILISGMYDGRQVRLSFDEGNGEDTTLTVSKVELDLKHEIHGRFLIMRLSALPGVQTQDDPKIGTQYVVRASNPPRLVALIFANRELRGYLRLEGEKKPLVERLELRDSKLLLSSAVLIWPEDLREVVEVMGQLAETIETISPDDEVSDDNDIEIGEHITRDGTKIVSRRYH